MATPTRYDRFNDLARFMPLREFDDFFGMPRMRALFREMPAEARTMARYIMSLRP